MCRQASRSIRPGLPSFRLGGWFARQVLAGGPYSKLSGGSPTRDTPLPTRTNGKILLVTPRAPCALTAPADGLWGGPSFDPRLHPKRSEPRRRRAGVDFVVTSMKCRQYY